MSIVDGSSQCHMPVDGLVADAWVCVAIDPLGESTEKVIAVGLVSVPAVFLNVVTSVGRSPMSNV